MFFQLELLKRGGKFHLCWLANSWPDRFSSITQRQLWSVEISKLCKELLEMIQRESRSPNNRFSLRMSCQLVHGMTHLLRRQAIACLSDICILNANILRQNRLKDTPKEPSVHERGTTRGNATICVVQLPHPGAEEPVEELLERSVNTVARVEDITLREQEIPRPVFVDNGFGEQSEQAMNSLLGGTMDDIELMVGRAEQSMLGQVSGTDISSLHDSRDLRAHRDTAGTVTGTLPRMEGIVEDSFLLLNVPDGQLDQPIPEYAPKDIPEIPEIQATHPDISNIQESIQQFPDPTIIQTYVRASVREQGSPPPLHSTPAPPMRKPPPQRMEEEFQLETVDLPTRRRPKKLKVDKIKSIESAQMRARIASPLIETRCQNSEEDHAEINVPTEFLFKRPSCAGVKNHVNISNKFLNNFQRCCMLAKNKPREEIELQRKKLEVPAMNMSSEPTNITFKTPEPRPVAVLPSSGRLSMEGRSSAEGRPSTAVRVLPQLPLIAEEGEADRSLLDLAQLPSIVVTRGTGDENGAGAMDIWDLPTQLVPEDGDTQERVRKRTPDQSGGDEIPSKLRRVTCYSIQTRARVSHQQGMDEQPVAPTQEPLSQQPIDADQQQELHHPTTEEIPQQSEQTKSPAESSTVLQLAAPPDEPSEEPECGNTRQSRRTQDSLMETPLGSLDKTLVSLGDSPDSGGPQQFIKQTWGTEATMCRIAILVKLGDSSVTVKKLVDMVPVPPGTRRLAAAACFSSILKLKNEKFVKVVKHEVTSEIINIGIGQRIVDEA